MKVKQGIIRLNTTLLEEVLGIDGKLKIIFADYDPKSGEILLKVEGENLPGTESGGLLPEVECYFSWPRTLELKTMKIWRDGILEKTLEMAANPMPMKHERKKQDYP